MTGPSFTSPLPLRGRGGGGVTSRQLRKNQTDAERKMWFIPRDLDWPKAHFRRQVKIGQYFADFLSHHFKMVIEVDGSQHFEPDGLARDKARTAFLGAEGFSVIRFGNNDVLGNPAGVADKIIDILSSLTPTPTPPHKGEGREETILPHQAKVGKT
jgi:very-short-patch-repair endonuclease